MTTPKSVPKSGVSVPTATSTIKPTTQNAVAIAYETGSSAPKIVAKGKGLIAEQIIARAKEHGVYVHQSKELVSLLMKVELDQDIPPALYRAVAELLAWLYHIESEKSASALVPPKV
ncbi:flagellar biosynthesis protein [Undibacterium sp. GrIS 1.8]|uniref:EscU/YscU/HrcU family type III secretion system export apparatus switch protein n=1 Tax=unclassified Undibacterium TaxID=2630295 RepID=UPI003394C264